MQAIENALAIEGAKTSLSLVTIAAMTTGAPIFAPVAGLGLAAYGATVALDYFLTGKLYLFPLWRIGAGELLSAAGGRSLEMACDQWDESYRSRPGLESALPMVPQLEPSTIDVPVVRPVPVHRLPQPIYPELDAPFEIADRYPMQSPIAQSVGIPADRGPSLPVPSLADRSGLPPVIARVSSTPTADTLAGSLWNICDRNNNFFCVGAPGSGKGMWLANLLRRKLGANPNSLVVAFDPKGDHKEDGYWAHPQIHRYSFKGMASNREQWDAQAIEFLRVSQIHIKRVLEANENDPSRFHELWILFDEMLGMKRNLSPAVFEMVKTALSNAVSMGDSSGIHGICLTQSFNAGDSVDSEEILKNLCLVGTFREDDYSRVAKIVRLGKTSVSSMSKGEFDAIAAKSPRGRVMCVGGQFIPSPELANHSTWDRDKKVVLIATQPRPQPDTSNPEGDLWETADASPTPARSPLALPRVPING